MKFHFKKLYVKEIKVMPGPKCPYYEPLLDSTPLRWLFATPIDSVTFICVSPDSSLQIIRQAMNSGKSRCWHFQIAFFQKILKKLVLRQYKKLLWNRRFVTYSILWYLNIMNVDFHMTFSSAFCYPLDCDCFVLR